MVTNYFVGFNAARTAFYVVGERPGKKDFLLCFREVQQGKNKFLYPIWYVNADKRPTKKDKNWVENCAKELNAGTTLLVNIGEFSIHKSAAAHYSTYTESQLDQIQKGTFENLAWGIANYFYSEGVDVLQISGHQDLPAVRAGYREWDMQRKIMKVSGSTARLGETKVRDFQFI